MSSTATTICGAIAIFWLSGLESMVETAHNMCLSPWSQLALYNHAEKRAIVPRLGQAFFLCQSKLASPGLNDTYNVTWTHLGRVIIPQAAVNSDKAPTDTYIALSDGVRNFGLVIDQVTETSVGYVTCAVTPTDPSSRAESFAQQFHLYVQIGPDQMFTRRMENRTVTRGLMATFDCYVYFDVFADDLCGINIRFRWSHQGQYASVPNDFGHVPQSDNYFVQDDGLRTRKTQLQIIEVDESDEGPVKCEVRWGPGADDWVAQEAYLSVV